MNAYSKSEKGYSKQLAAGYIIYMMGGSLFRKSICMNPCEESHLYLHYAAMPVRKMEETEGEVLKSLARLDGEFCRLLGELKCEVHFRREGGRYHVIFSTGGFESVEGIVDEDGRFWIEKIE